MRKITNEVAAQRLREQSVLVESGCMEWQGVLNYKGYGQTQFKGAFAYAHRAAYEMAHGSPGDSHVLHTCDNRKCVNPEHLVLGTNHDNIHDKARKGRAGKRLTLESAKEIKAMLAQGISQREIAATFDIDQSCVSDIKTGQSWRLALEAA